jgi:hypothetical protein
VKTKTIPATVAVARVIAPVHIILSLLCVAQKRQNPAAVKYWQTTLAIPGGAISVNRAGRRLQDN